MKDLKPCKRFQAHPDRLSRCFWCGWDEVPHIVPEDGAFEFAYWDTLLNTGDTDDSSSCD